jgi:hypothetical protein
MPEMSIPTTFSIDFVSGFTPVNDLISQVRARIYYKGGNRNGTWITDEFAEKLNKTLPYVPIVASYNAETEDFEGHIDQGNKKAYGVVPLNSNFRWEKGDDGKEYATTDVYLWTGYWPEAAKIVNKSQSMELNKNSIVGDWKVIGGEYYFVYQDGSYKGLCALGDVVMPCFENSAFYNLDEESRSFFENLNKINEKNPEGGSEEMGDTQENFEEKVDNSTEQYEAPVEEVEATVTTDEFGVLTETIETTRVDTMEDDTGYKSTVTEESKITVTCETPDQTDSGDQPTMYSAEEYDAKVNEIATLTTRISEFEIQVSTLKTEIENLSVYKATLIKKDKENIIEQFKRNFIFC